jgi:hypothetical protein
MVNKNILSENLGAPKYLGLALIELHIPLKILKLVFKLVQALIQFFELS